MAKPSEHAKLLHQHAVKACAAHADEINDALAAANCDFRVEAHPHCFRVYDADGEGITIVPLDTTWQALALAEKFLDIGFRRGETRGRDQLAAQLRALIGAAPMGASHG